MKFPPDFHWGVGTSAHQVEGANTRSDWWHWEHQKKFDHHPLPITNKRLEKSGMATNHRSLWRNDVALMARLGIRNYRFSVEWAKIEPSEGQWDERALRFYEELCNALREDSIAPMVTLLHFTLPNWVAQRGGWSNPQTPVWFERFTTKIAAVLSPKVRHWITINEPFWFLVSGYLVGAMPPDPPKKTPKNLRAPLRHVLTAHARAYKALHSTGQPHTQVGLAHHMRVFEPHARQRWTTPALARLLDRVFNWSVPLAAESGRLKLHFPFALRMDEEISDLAGTQDFVGLNYYSRDIVRRNLRARPLPIELQTKADTPTNDLGWEIYPEGMLRLLRDIQRNIPNKPIIITENGIADRADQHRANYIDGHVRSIERALGEGIPVLGYYHWSLLDNYEWAEGFGPRFGLVEVDYRDFRRTPRPSAWHYKKVIETH